MCDTNIVIELFKGNEQVKNTCLAIGENNLVISAITVGEFYFGALNKKEIPIIRKHLEKFATVHLTPAISVLFTDLMAKYCLSHKPFVPDMLIAASCLHYNIPLFTHNVKDFQFIPEIELYLS